MNEREMQNYIMHYGVKGMRWGHRKDKRRSSSRNKGAAVKTKYGETLYFGPNKSRTKNSYAYSIRNEKGKKVANYYLDKVSEDELNINWLNTKKKHRGKGYASAIIKRTDQLAKELGVKKITAEAVGSSKDIQHILRKYGYKTVGKTLDEENEIVWGGLQYVEKTLSRS